LNFFSGADQFSDLVNYVKDDKMAANSGHMMKVMLASFEDEDNTNASLSSDFFSETSGN